MNIAKIQNDLRINGDWTTRLCLDDYENRRLFLYGEIIPTDRDCGDGIEMSDTATSLTYLKEWIMRYNREDIGKPIESRKAIKLYISSPGGDPGEGFSLIDIMKISKTPVHTINFGQWASTAFLIGINGHKRLSLSRATFLLHDGTTFAYGTTSKVQDHIKFSERFEREVVKKHVLEHSKMTNKEYLSLSRKEVYMLPEDAIKYSFIDEIVTDIDTIL